MHVDLNFEVITWRFYKGFANNGSILTAGAMVLRKPHDGVSLELLLNQEIISHTGMKGLTSKPVFGG